MQRRAGKTNCCIVLFPLLLFSAIGGLQIAINVEMLREFAAAASIDCGGCGGGVAVAANATGGLDCPTRCALPRAPKWPPLLQIPPPERRAVGDGDLLSSAGDLPDAASCRAAGSCAAAFLVTGGNRSFVASMLLFLFFWCSYKVVLLSRCFIFFKKKFTILKNVSGSTIFVLKYCYLV